jgi:MinD superfamily P-loop ATPase
MKELVIVSGKGGTGKTSLTAAFADLYGRAVLCDADVDASNLHLIMNPQVQQQFDFFSGHSAIINPQRCSQCGACIDLCQWDAIGNDFMVDDLQCEGCGVCVHLCPENAIDFPINKAGDWYISDTRFGKMVHAALGIAEESSGKLVTRVRKEAKKIAENDRADLILTDGPPGIGCPVIASIGGASALLVVTEPTMSGWHDAKRMLSLANRFGATCMMVINKFDLNLEQSANIEMKAIEKGVPVVGKLPFDPLFNKAMMQEKTIFEYNGYSTTCAQVEQLWNSITDKLDP